MITKEITDKKIWEEYVQKQSYAPFLQGWAWGEFQLSLGAQVKRIFFEENGKVCAASQVIVTKRKLAKFMYVPYGPILDWSDSRLAGQVLDSLQKMAREWKVDYLRLDPRQEDQSGLREVLRSAGFKKSSTFVQVEVGWILDIEKKTEDELLRQMRETTRYLIRKAPKVGVKVEITADPNKMKIFHQLMEATSKRHRFTPQHRKYLQKQFEVLSKEGVAKLFIASHQEGKNSKPYAAAVVMFYGDNAAYVHGASDNSMSNKIPAAYALQWRAVVEARKQGKKIYDFWGVAPKEEKSHPWYGLSLFKKGFGGRSVPFVGAWDYQVTTRYLLVRLIEIYYNLRRGL